MFAALKIEPGDFLDTYKDAKGEERKQYRLDRDLTMTLVTKYDTSRRSMPERTQYTVGGSTTGRGYLKPTSLSIEP